MPIKIFQASEFKNVYKLEDQINAWVANLQATDKMQLQVSAAISEGPLAGWTVPYVVVAIWYSTAPAPAAEAKETTGQ
jgi:hypothetical protein